MRIGIALGSNLGDRAAHLRAGIAALESLPQTHLLAVAGAYETDPVDCPPGSQPFFNTVVELETSLTASALHEHTQRIERELGRSAQRERHAPRPLDLDLLYTDGDAVITATLELPHPRMAQRRFVLQPLATIRPQLVLAATGRSVLDTLHALPDGAESVRLVPELTLRPGFAPMLSCFDQMRERKLHGPPLAVLTAYDYPTARLLDEAGVDLLLVGDSLGMVVHGMADTTQVTMEMMVHHVAAVARAKPRARIIGDLPAHSYDTPTEALRNARRLMDAGAHAVKLEGGVSMIPQVRAIIAAGIPFIGHIGMLPQSVREEGGYKKKGKTAEGAALLMADALALDDAGALGMVLESIVPAVAAEITRAIRGSSIGIGAGKECDGQVLVTHDLIGSFPWFRPPFAKARADVASATMEAAKAYVAEVHSRGGLRTPGLSVS